MKRQHITGFYIETLVLVAVFVAAVLLLTQIFGISRNKSRSASLLTSAVTLAENAAEAISYAKDPQQAAQLLNMADNAICQEEGITAYYGPDLMPAPDGVFRVQAGWEPETGEAGTLVNSRIFVWYGQEEEPLYVLDTAVYLPEVIS